MSMYSGKCDLYDWISGKTDKEIMNMEIYIGSKKEPLKFTDPKELIPYYPYIVCVGCFNNQEKKSVMVLSSESYVDREEREVLEYYLERLMVIYRRCKRKKIEFTVEDAVKEITSLSQEYVLELGRRVKEMGTKANIDGIHMETRDFYREKLVEEMLKNGLDPAAYGYERFLKKANGSNSNKGD